MQEKKLFGLQCDSSKSSTPDPDKTIFNYSPEILSAQEKILAYSLNFAVATESLVFAIFTPFEFLFKQATILTKSGYDRLR